MSPPLGPYAPPPRLLGREGGRGVPAGAGFGLSFMASALEVARCELSSVLASACPPSPSGLVGGVGVELEPPPAQFGMVCEWLGVP
jgi:hypothetical protein